MAELPQSQPLCSPEELLNWTPTGPNDTLLLQAVVELQPVPADQPDRPKLLACHDMRGGYLDDRFAQGTGDGDAYTFRAWNLIDIFVYFSHKLVTIPPVGWINAGHLHGVPVLGTFITEWQQGQDYCRQLFASEAAVEQCAQQLVRIAQHFRFDGWLINIENELDVQLVPCMIYFLRTLTQLMRSINPSSEVIWYDAVTTQGKLRWQNSLTDLNQPFFEACDGLFVNYTWREGTPQEVQHAAGCRRTSVYMGVDCFGRGSLGGGGMHCSAALKALQTKEHGGHGLSAALFAQAWPYDHSIWPGCASWRQCDELFWSKIQQAWSRQQRLTVTQLPFYTDFSDGTGRALMQQGRFLHRNAWSNLSRLQPQPVLEWVGLAPTDITGSVSSWAAFSGGSSLHVRGSALSQAAWLRLFSAAAVVPASSGLAVSWTVSCNENVNAALILSMQQGSSTFRVRCDNSGTPLERHSPFQVQLPQTEEAPFTFLSQDQLDNSSISGDVAAAPAWITYSYVLTPTNTEGCQLMSLDLELTSAAQQHAAVELWLGQVTVRLLSMPDEPAGVSQLSFSEVVLERAPMPGPSGEELQLSTLFTWKCSPGLQRCHIWVRRSSAEGYVHEWVGQAHAPGFRVCNFLVEPSMRSVCFAVQAVSKTNQAQPLQHAPVVDVSLPELHV